MLKYKNKTSKIVLFAVLSFSYAAFNAVFAANFNFNGSGGPYNLNSGDTLSIQSGTFTQSLSLPSGAVIEVASGASFKPSALNNSAGTLLVSPDAVVVLPAVVFNAGVVIDNSGDFTFSSGVDLNGTVTIINRSQTTGLVVPTMRFTNGYQLSQNSVIDNQGLMTFQQDFNTESGSSLTNTGTITMQNFNPNGSFVNDGYIKTAGHININSQGSVKNNCTFLAEQGFINSGIGTSNNGIIITTGPLSQIRLNNPFHQSAQGYMQGEGTGSDAFTNNTLVTGGGNYYFIGETRNNALFGVDLDGDTINFYDSNIADSSKYFDVENTTPLNTTKNSITPITGSQALTNCTYAEIMKNTIPDPSLDYGDAPISGLAPNGTSAANYGEASHTITPGLYLGSTEPDKDVTNQADANAAGDDNNGTDDEDGALIPAMKRGESYNVPVVVNGAGGYLQAWIDWNGDGDFTDTGEQIASDLQDTGALSDIVADDGTINVSVTVPVSATLSPTFARFRWSTTPAIGAVGSATDGEVEDYILTIADADPIPACLIDDIDTRQYSSASPAASSRFLTEKTFVYEATFDTADWSGEILAYNLFTDQGQGGTKSVIWSSTSTVKAGNRSLYTYNPEAESVRGTELSWDTLNQQQKNWFARTDGEPMGQARVKWLQGVTDTTEPGNSLRSRSQLLGDIIHSSLTLRDPITNYGYKSLPGTEGSEYAAFLASKLNSSPSLMFGTNDGMFHSLDPQTGEEHFAYIPNEVISRLPNISDPNYGCTEDNCLKHEYTVDGVSTLGDAYLTSGWRSVLVGTLGLGGRGLFALDLTDPDNFSETDVLWEISSKQAPDNAAVFAQHLGYTQPSVSIVRLKSGQWAAVFGNGYDSESHQAVLFVVDVETGELIKTFNTLTGTSTLPNGLSTPTVVDTDGDLIADRIYAGDLLGNLWAFDISDEDSAAWTFAYGSNTKPKSFFQACTDDSCSDTQAITAAPQVGKNTVDGLMVYVGTGKYFDVSDGDIASSGAGFNSFYGLQDNGTVVKRSELVKQEILADVAVSDDLKSRITSNNRVDYTNKRGWFLDLLTPPVAGTDGERVISKAILRGGRIIFTTLTPSVAGCALGGSSWIMEINAQSGARLSMVAFDVNDDMAFTEADNSLYEDSPTIISGLQQLSLGLVRSAPVIMQHTTRSEGKYVSGSETGVGMFRESATQFSGRMSWTSISN